MIDELKSLPKSPHDDAQERRRARHPSDGGYHRSSGCNFEPETERRSRRNPAQAGRFQAAEIPVKVLSPAVHEYQKEFEMQPVLDGQLPKFCIAHHCTERGPKCAKCAYTAFSSSHRRRLEGRA